MGCGVRGREVRMLNKKVLLPVCLVLSLMLMPMASAGSGKAVVHFEGKTAFAIVPLDGSRVGLCGAVEGLLNLPGPQGPLKGMFEFWVVIDMRTCCIVEVEACPLEKGDFKWSMDHAIVTDGFMSDGETMVWYSVPPTRTGHVNLKDIGFFDMDHVVANWGFRFAEVWKYCEPECYFGIIARGTGTLTFTCGFAPD
jgi:hypothetical protein